MPKYVSDNTLSFFLSKLKTIFPNINHTHTIEDVNNLQSTLNAMQGEVDNLEQSVADLEGNLNPDASFETETWTFTLVDGSVVSKQVLVK